MQEQLQEMLVHFFVLLTVGMVRPDVSNLLPL